MVKVIYLDMKEGQIRVKNITMKSIVEKIVFILFFSVRDF